MLSLYTTALAQFASARQIFQENKFMKKISEFNRFLAMTLTPVLTFMLITPVLAANRYETTEEKPVSKKNLPGVRAALFQSIRNQDGQTQYSPEDLEQMRTALLELVDSNQELSTLLSPQGKGRVRSDLGLEKDEDQFAEVRNRIQQMTGEQLTNLRKVLNPSKMRAKLASSRATFSEYKNSLMKAAYDSANSPGLPGIDSYCGAPVPTAAIIAADAIFFLAEGVRDLAQNVCNEVVVVIGGGNTRLLCIPTDILYLVAKAVNQAIHFCDDDYAASVGQASYDRLGHINDDLTDIKANDNANYTNIIGNAATNTTTITAAVSTAKTDVVTNDNKNTGTITTAVSNAQTAVIKAGDANSAAIINNDDRNKGEIVANDNTNRILLITDAKANRDFVLRTQIEADLSSTDGAVFVALFLTPGNICAPVLNDKGEAQSGNAQCGYLDFARAIVVQTIANLAGSNKSQANAFLTKGDNYKASGDYKQAYQNYRHAYKTAIK